MSCRSMFQIQVKQSLPVSLPNTHEQERHLRLSSSAACAFRRSKNAGISFSKDAQIFMASANHPDLRVTSAETTLTSPSTSITNTANTGWTEFSERVSGEWDGFRADFTVEGKPVELPESVVPEAYREWEVKVFDWQTQCPTLAHFNHGVPYFMYKAIKLLPTVGCEADAATRYSVQERIVTPPHHSALAYQSSGCYVSVWPISKDKIKSVNEVLELEHCLIDPRDKESRVRVIQVLGFNNSELRLQNVKVFVEQWYGPFRNGDQLGGCAISNYAFATTQPLSGSKVTGSWQGVGAIAAFHNSQNMIQQLGDEYVHKSIRDEGELILLPKNLWCSIKRGENKETDCEVGWLLDQGQAITSKCTFSSAVEVKVSNLRKASLSFSGKGFLNCKRPNLGFRVSCAAKPETVNKVCEIVRKQLALPADRDVTGDSKFATLGADSLDTVEIVMGLEEEFGISVEEESAQSITTVQDAADLIEKIMEKN